MSQEVAIAKRVKWWSGVYEYHQQQAPSEAVLRQYAKDMLEYGGEDLNKAWLSWRSQSGFAPKPGDLMPFMERRMSIDDLAQLCAQYLMECVSHYAKFGTCAPDGSEKWIRENIGDVGLRVVQQLGGWRAIWARSEKLLKDPEMTIASWKKMFKPLLDQIKTDGPIALPSESEARRFMTKVNTSLMEGNDGKM